MPADSPNPQPIKVILADDQPVVRAGVRRFLENAGGFLIVGEAASAQEAMALIQLCQPHVVVLDIQLSKGGGVEVCQFVRTKRWPIGLLTFNALGDEASVAAFLKSGANGFILKTAPAEALINAVREVCQGKPVVEASVLSRVLAQAHTSRTAPLVEALSGRELDILTRVAKGLTNKTIAHHLNISDRTVQAHIARIFEKLQSNSRTEAVMRAIALGLIKSPETVNDEPYAYEI